jgi:hypothetical protein
MHQLSEVTIVRQLPGERRRRWFSSSRLDLIVWFEELGVPRSFQLCYDKDQGEHAITWTPELGFVHMAVDDGETDVGLRHKAAPILVADGSFSANRILEIFREASPQLPTEIVEFVTDKLKGYSDDGARA